jgi:hypothetical protein
MTPSGTLLDSFAFWREIESSKIEMQSCTSKFKIDLRAHTAGPLQILIFEFQFFILHFSSSISTAPKSEYLASQLLKSVKGESWR